MDECLDPEKYDMGIKKMSKEEITGLMWRLLEHRVELTGDCTFSFGGKEGELESLWGEYSANMQGRTLDTNYTAFTLPTFLEKVAPLIPMLEEQYNIKYEYLKSLGAGEGMAVEAGAWYELRIYHPSNGFGRDVCILWNGCEEGEQKLEDSLRYLLNMLVRISYHGPAHPRYLHDD